MQKETKMAEGKRERSFVDRFGDWFMDRIEKATKELDAEEAVKAEDAPAQTPVAPLQLVPPHTPAADRDAAARALQACGRFEWRDRMAVKYEDPEGHRGGGYVYGSGNGYLSVVPMGSLSCVSVHASGVILELKDPATIGILLGEIQRICFLRADAGEAMGRDLLSGAMLDGDKVARRLLELWA